MHAVTVFLGGEVGFRCVTEIAGVFAGRSILHYSYEITSYVTVYALYFNGEIRTSHSKRAERL